MRNPTQQGLIDGAAFGAAAVTHAQQNFADREPYPELSGPQAYIDAAETSAKASLRAAGYLVTASDVAELAGLTHSTYVHPDVQDQAIVLVKSSPDHHPDGTQWLLQSHVEDTFELFQ